MTGTGLRHILLRLLDQANNGEYVKKDWIALQKASGAAGHVTAEAFAKEFSAEPDPPIQTFWVWPDDIDEEDGMEIFARHAPDAAMASQALDIHEAADCVDVNVRSRDGAIEVWTVSVERSSGITLVASLSRGGS